MPGGTLLKGGKELRKKIVTMAIIAAMSGVIVTSAITCSASTFADAVNSLSDSFDANKTEEENEAEEESSSSAEDVADDNTDATNEDVTDETSETENNETGKTPEISETTASEDTSETSEETAAEDEPEDESQPTATPEAEKKDTKKKKKWFSITIWDILKQLSWAMVLMVIPGYCIFKRSKK